MHRVSAHHVDDLAAYLLGRWRVDREILDGDREPVGRFAGDAVFVAAGSEPGLLRYEERGTLRLGAHRGPAFRRLLYRVDGARAEVAFEDGRPFHDLDLRTGRTTADHPCGDDHYRGRFEVVDASTWTHEWVVEGPHKDHLLRTTLFRRGEAEARTDTATAWTRHDPR
jgi:hypothetical protein